MDKLISSIIYIGFIIVMIIFLNQKKINQTTFAILFIAATLYVLAYQALDRLVELDIGNQKLILKEVVEARDEVTTRVDEIKTAYIKIADLFTTVAFAGAFSGDMVSELKNRRLTAKEMYELAGVSNSEIAQKLRSVDSYILYEFLGKVKRLVFEKMRAFNLEYFNSIKEDITNVLNELENRALNVISMEEEFEILERFEEILKIHEIPLEYYTKEYEEFLRYRKQE